MSDGKVRWLDSETSQEHVWMYRETGIGKDRIPLRASEINV